MTERAPFRDANPAVGRPPLVGRADLVFAFANASPEDFAASAQALGYVIAAPMPPESSTENVHSFHGLSKTSAKNSDEAGAAIHAWPAELMPVEFSRCTQQELLYEWSESELERPPCEIVWSEPPNQPARARPLSSWSRLIPRMRRMLTAVTPGQELNLSRAVDQLARGDVDRPLPRHAARRWGSTVQVLVDRSERLMPYFIDQDLVVRQLRKLLGSQQLEIYYGKEIGFQTGTDFRLWDRVQGFRHFYDQPVSHGHVLILGDLGCLEAPALEARQKWRAFAKQLDSHGSRVLALVPCHVGRLDRELARVIRVEAMAEFTKLLGHDERQQFTRRLLGLIAHLDRLEPGLLRECRLLLDGGSDPGLEADAWQDKVVVERRSDAATLASPDVLEPFTQIFAQESPSIQRAVIELLPRWRTTIGPEVYFEELSRLPANTLKWVKPQDLAEAILAWRYLVAQCEAETSPERNPVFQYSKRVFGRMCLATRLHPQFGPLAGRIAQRMTENQLPVSVSPEPRPFRVSQEGETLVFRPLDGDGLLASSGGGSFLATIHTRNGWVGIWSLNDHGEPMGHPQSVNLFRANAGGVSLPIGPQYELRTETEAKVFHVSPRSPSASSAGRDKFGLWEETEIAVAGGKPVTLRWRWIPPGTFWMGSPEDEPGRWGDEGPRHLVTLTKGFWMAETPCTQELWQSVMGENPSHFRNKPQNPVESVSFRDVEGFCEKVNVRLLGEIVSPPTEAQWEYACRAGSQGAVYRVTGSPEKFQIDENGKAAVLDPIAWYSGNSSGTSHSVRTKLPNAWGLYDMLGNVWEWCRDAKLEYDSQPQTDPEGGAGGSRVIRGGGWYDYARGVRCANRYRNGVDYQVDFLGFRLVRVQNS